ncbi:hypothetical protein ANO14919_059880 [Xylariales sp. No.14919]|nr:hypothetical protein ANO14919_059880 [Xylariales sp. No.14919]
MAGWVCSVAAAYRASRRLSASRCREAPSAILSSCCDDAGWEVRCAGRR